MAASHIPPHIVSTDNEQTARHAKAPIEPRSLLRRYGVAGLCAGGAVLLRWILNPALGPLLPLSTTFGFVAVAVWYGGWGLGAFTALASYLAVKWLFIEPRFAFSAGVQDLWGFAAYLSSVAVIIAVGDAMAAKLDAHVVLMDINMPCMDGVEATRRIKKDRPETVVIGLSVNNSNHVMEAMKQAGAGLFVSKDAASEQLYDAIAAVMSHVSTEGARQAKLF